MQQYILQCSLRELHSCLCFPLPSLVDNFSIRHDCRSSSFLGILCVFQSSAIFSILPVGRLKVCRTHSIPVRTLDEWLQSLYICQTLIPFIVDNFRPTNFQYAPEKSVDEIIFQVSQQYNNTGAQLDKKRVCFNFLVSWSSFTRCFTR